MHLFNKIKRSTFAVATLLAVMATADINASAKTITEPKETTKQVTTVSTDIQVRDAANLKINGKKYTKGSIKKKIATTKFGTNARAYQSWKGSFTEYYNEEDIVYNTEAHKKAMKNYKWISTSNFELKFLKTGTYKISYDTYSYTSDRYKFGSIYENENDDCDFYRAFRTFGGYDENGNYIDDWCPDDSKPAIYAEVTLSPDTKTATVTPVLFKTKHIDTYKIVQTTSGLKAIALGKSKQTYTVSSNGTKTTRKTIYKNRYLKGNSGKVKYTMNKNYAFTGAIAVTRDVNGNIVISNANKNAKLAYSAGVYTNTETYDEYILDATGAKTYVIDPATGQPTDEYATREVVVGTQKDKYKYTTIHYGYKDKFTGAYTKYSVAARPVYIQSKDANGNPLYQKDANGDFIYDDDYDRIPVTEPATATVITKEYLEYGWVNGAYVPVTVIKEMVLLPEDLTADKKFDIDEGTTKTTNISDNDQNHTRTKYFLDNAGQLTEYSNNWNEVSRNGYSNYSINAQNEWVYNPAVSRMFYYNNYKGHWAIYNKDTMNSTNCNMYTATSTSYADYTVNPDGTKTYTYYAYVYDLDARGEKIPRTRDITSYVYFGNTSGIAEFKAK